MHRSVEPGSTRSLAEPSSPFAIIWIACNIRSSFDSVCNIFGSFFNNFYSGSNSICILIIFSRCCNGDVFTVIFSYFAQQHLQRLLLRLHLERLQRVRRRVSATSATFATSARFATSATSSTFGIYCSFCNFFKLSESTSASCSFCNFCDFQHLLRLSASSAHFRLSRCCANCLCPAADWLSKRLLSPVQVDR